MDIIVMIIGLCEANSLVSVVRLERFHHLLLLVAVPT